MGQDVSSGIEVKRCTVEDDSVADNDINRGVEEYEVNDRSYFKDGILHRYDGSITILEDERSEYLQRGNLTGHERSEYYKQMAKCKRDGQYVVGPFLEWWKDGLLNNERGPAIQRIDWRGDREEWWIRGKRHREGNEPAVVVYNIGGDVIRQEWWVDGKRHRENGNPAVVHNDGRHYYEEWWVNGHIHRENGPAFISKYEEIWFKWGLKHREDGPADIIRYMGNVRERWYIAGELLDTPLMRPQKKNSPRLYSIIGKMAVRRLSKTYEKYAESPTSSCSTSPSTSANTSPFNSPRSIPSSPLSSPRDVLNAPTTPRKRNRVFWNKTDEKVIMKDKDRRSQLSASKSMDMIESVSQKNISHNVVQSGGCKDDSLRNNIKGMGKSMTEFR